VRKKDERIRALLLNCALEIVNEKGIGAVNIRKLAARAGVATGTVYNYFSSKDDVLLALTEDDWTGALQQLGQTVKPGRFSERVMETYAFLHEHIHASAGGMMAALINIRQTGCTRMETMQTALRGILLKQLRLDDNVKNGVWNETFTPERFAQFVLDYLMVLLRSDAQDAGFLSEIVKRTLY
jgi:AcrR family transcriptional regulator